MSLLKWITITLAVVEAGWMVFDGVRALTVGSYVAPRTGPYAGQPGPWANLLSMVGLKANSTLVKSIFVVYGVVWLSIVGCFIAGYGWSRWAMMAAAIGSLWYIPFGTLLSVVQIILLSALKNN